MTQQPANTGFTLKQFIEKLVQDQKTETSHIINFIMIRLNNMIAWGKLLVCIGNYQIEFEEEFDPELMSATVTGPDGHLRKSITKTINHTMRVGVFKRNADFNGDLIIVLRDSPDIAYKIRYGKDVQVADYAFPQTCYCKAEAKAWQILAGFVFFREVKAKELKVYLRCGPDNYYLIHM